MGATPLFSLKVTELKLNKMITRCLIINYTFQTQVNMENNTRLIDLQKT